MKKEERNKGVTLALFAQLRRVLRKAPVHPGQHRSGAGGGSSKSDVSVINSISLSEIFKTSH